MRQPEQSNILCTGDATKNPAPQTSIDAKFRKSGFLPEQDPLTAFPRIPSSPCWMNRPRPSEFVA
jgi:hypothetical protein